MAVRQRKTNTKKTTDTNSEKKEITRGQKLMILLIIIGIVCIALLFGLFACKKALFTENPRFLLQNIIVKSNGYWNNQDSELANYLALNINQTNIWAINLKELQSEIIELPSVEQCTVIRRIPDAIEIDIIERIPRAKIAQNQSYLLDSSAYPIPVNKSMQISGNVPLIFGNRARIEIKNNIPISEFKLAVEILMLTIREFPELEIMAIDISNEDYYNLFLKYNGGKTKKVIVPAAIEGLETRFIALINSMRRANLQNVDFKIYDLSFQGQVVAK